MHKNGLDIFKSSAGSGKTYTLVKEYLKLALQYPSAFKSILAITFTNKATEEMKSRVIENLVQIISNESSSMRSSLVDETEFDEAGVRSRAMNTLQALLHDYSGLSITTIDSFFSSLVRNLARELNLPQRFSIELDTTLIIENVASTLLDSLDDDKDLRQWLEEYVIHLIEDEKNWNTFKGINEVGQEVVKERFYELFGHNNIYTVTPEYVKELKARKAFYRDSMKAFGQKFFKVLDDNKLTTEDFYHKGSGTVSHFKKIIDPKSWSDYEFGKRLQQTLDGEIKWSRKKDVNEQLIDELATSHLNPILRETHEFHNKYFEEYNTVSAILKNIYLAGLIFKFNEKLKKYRDEEEILLISDTPRILDNAIGNTDAPFVYEKTGNRYKHFMLDEFQDTSTLQWNNMLPLIKNGLGSGNYALLVGDIKQSIYRWRGGNMRLLLEKVTGDLHAFDKIINEFILEKNFRSYERVIHFNNHFFPAAADLIKPEMGEQWTELLKYAYIKKSVEQKFTKGINGEGYVEITYFKGGKDDDDDNNEVDTGMAEWKKNSLLKVHSTIIDLLEIGYRYKDICILVRTNSEAIAAISYLQQNGVNELLSAEAMLMKGSSKVRFVLALLRLALDHNDQISRSHIRYFSNIHLTHPPTDASGIFENDSIEELQKLVDIIKNMSTYEAVENICLSTGISRSPDPYIHKLLDVVREFDIQKGEGISGFLRWYDDHEEKDACSVNIPSDTNAINVMTIHKAKGLEFPVVIMPFADWKIHNDNKGLKWMKAKDKDFNDYPAFPLKGNSSLERSYFKDDYHDDHSQNLIDNLNLLYVSFTRAAQHLYVHTTEPAKKAEAVKNVKTIIHNILEQTQVLLLCNDAFENDCFSSGDRTCGPYPVDKDLRPLHSAEPPSTWDISSWQNKMWGVVNSDKISSMDKERPDTSFGILFHKIMSNYGMEFNDHKSLLSLLDKELLDIETYERIERSVKVAASLLKENNWDLSSFKILNEAEILKPDGKVYRPDLVLHNTEHTIIVDYKTGTASDEHAKQIRDYADCLSEMGMKDPQGYLLYTETEELVKAV